MDILTDFVFVYSSLVYVEGDASLNTYQDGEGNTRSALNIVQRTFCRNTHIPREEVRY